MSDSRTQDDSTSTPAAFSVTLEKDTLVFSAAHFITFDGNICERLHGHNYRVKCTVRGPLDENGYVIDFVALDQTLREIIATLDHRMLLPTKHPTIAVVQDGAEVVARFGDKRWVFPLEDCVLLEVANTTAELLAGHIAGELKAKLTDRLAYDVSRQIESLEVGVDENRGQWAAIVMPW